jgi:ABC-type glycerol-3-phosphate transport system substrate-binding protein
MKIARIIAAALVLSLVAAACGSDDSTTTTTGPDAVQLPPDDAIAVTITDVELGNDELTVRGEKPTPCNDLGSIVGSETGKIEIDIWAEPTDETCAQVIEPFEVSFTLPAADPDTPVLVNGREVGRSGSGG